MISKILSGGKTISPALGRPELAETRRQVLRFAVIGCCCVGIDLLTYTLLTRAGMIVPAAKGLAYLVGMMAGFIGNKFWTFRSARRSWREPLSYAAVYTCTLAVNIGLNSAILAAFGPKAKLVAFLVATGTTTVLNFLGLRSLSFRLGIRQRQSAQSPR